MNRVVIAFYKDIFNFLEVYCLLDSNSELDLFALQLIYLPRINASLKQFIEQQNFHGIRAGKQKKEILKSMEKNQKVDNLKVKATFAFGVSTLSSSSLFVS